MSKILVIEDEPELLETVAEWLRFEDHTVYLASNGQEGIELAFRELPDLILSDVMMPGLDGYRVLLEVRARAETAVIPFIFITALSDRGDWRRGMEGGADDYITKPFTRKELLQAVNSRLTRQAINQQHEATSLDELRHSILRTLPHELRTPLTGILGFAEMLFACPECFSPVELKEMGSLLLDSGNRLLHTIENHQFYIELLLNQDNAQRGGLQANPNVGLSEVGPRIARQYQRPDDLYLAAEDAAIQMSAANWERLTTELLDNAFKFSQAGTPVQVHGQRTDSGYQLLVQDQGRGMRPESAAQIGPYMQFDRSYHEQQGSGLGLAIAQKLAQLAGGQLKIATVLGEGTAVTVTIPLLDNST